MITILIVIIITVVGAIIIESLLYHISISRNYKTKIKDMEKDLAEIRKSVRKIKRENKGPFTLKASVSGRGVVTVEDVIEYREMSARDGFINVYPELHVFLKGNIGDNPDIKLKDALVIERSD